MGIEQIKDHIRNTVDEKVKEILRRANLVRDREIDQAKKKASSWVQQQIKAFLREKITLIAKYKARTYKDLFLERTKVEEEIWEDFLQGLRGKINSLRTEKRDKYISLLLRCLRSAVECCKGRIKIYVNPEDVDLMTNLVETHYKHLESAIIPDKRISAGLIVKDDSDMVSISYDLLEILDVRSGEIKRYLFSKLENALEEGNKV